MAAATPWMATHNAPEREIETFERSVFTESLQGILRTGWGKPAGVGQKG